VNAGAPQAPAFGAAPLLPATAVASSMVAAGGDSCRWLAAVNELEDKVAASGALRDSKLHAAANAVGRRATTAECLSVCVCRCCRRLVQPVSGTSGPYSDEVQHARSPRG
jgi:hypothetical protein